MILTKGDIAPLIELTGTPDNEFGFADLEGKLIILAFYPADWSPVCNDQMALYNEVLELFQKFNAELIGISVDSKWCHKAFAENRKLTFPLLSDFEPKGALSKKYGVYDEMSGASKRALFVIDEKRVVQWSYLSPDDINPGADGILDALEQLSISKK